MELEHRFIDVNGIRMHTVLAGPEEAPAIILLHGFPEFWWSWRFQIPALIEAGYRVIAPDQRGYNTTGKSSPFGIHTLVQDIVSLQDALGVQRISLVGHDWGGLVAWAFAGLHPERTESLTVLNAPHFSAYRDTIWRHPIQIIKSGYIFFFQLPYLPERTLKAANYKAIERSFRSVNERYMTDEDISQYKEACSQPGALTAMLGWYRAAFWDGLQNRNIHRRLLISSPTQVIWGVKDIFLDYRCNETLPRYVSNLTVQYVPHANHWVQMDAPSDVNNLLLSFLKSRQNIYTSA